MSLRPTARGAARDGGSLAREHLRRQLDKERRYSRHTVGILENAKFPIHKWEYYLLESESKDAVNQSKKLGTLGKRQTIHWTSTSVL